MTTAARSLHYGYKPTNISHQVLNTAHYHAAVFQLPVIVPFICTTICESISTQEELWAWAPIM